VQGTDIKRYRKPLTYARHESTVNVGPHRIHTGPGHPSRIVLPIVPANHLAADPPRSSFLR